MEYRRLGRTGLQVSVLGMGGGYVMLNEIEEGTRVYRRAEELGVNYFDGRYGFSSVMIAPIIRQGRERFVVGTKTGDVTAEGAMKRIEEDLRELDTDYIDVFYLRTYNHEMREKHFGPGGSVEALLKAREQGKIRFLGMADHGDMSVLVEGIKTGLIDVVIFPLNIIRREALTTLIPVAQQHDVGLGVMKPVSGGPIPAPVALPWLANQPIHTMAPGIHDIAQLEQDVAAVERDPMALSAEEEAEVERWRQNLDQATCRICDAICKPLCEKKLPIDWIMHHDVFYNEFRRLGLQDFMEHPYAGWVRARLLRHFERRMEAMQACTKCGKCEEVCPHGIHVMDIFTAMIEEHIPLIEALKATNWDTIYTDAKFPF